MYFFGLIIAQQNAIKKANISESRPFKLTQKQLSVGETSTSSRGKAIDVVYLRYLVLILWY